MDGKIKFTEKKSCFPLFYVSIFPIFYFTLPILACDGPADGKQVQYLTYGGFKTSDNNHALPNL